jgi:hypothetical protein
MMPLYKITINEDDDTGVQANAFVDMPAHMKGSINFDIHKKPIKYDFNEEKRMVTGVMISAGTPIYRRSDDEAPEHYVYFPPEEIEKIVNKFMRNGFNNSLNEMHDPSKPIQGVKMIHSYIIGGVNNPQAPEAFKGQNLQKGTWIATYHVANDAIWNKVKSGEFQGFSVEGLFDRTEITVKHKYKSNKSSMKKPNFWQLVFGKADSFAEVTTADGLVLKYEGDLAEGTAVFMDADGVDVPATAGEYAVEIDGVPQLLTIDDNGLVVTLVVVEASAEGDEMKADEFVAFMKKFSAEQNERFVELQATCLAQQSTIDKLVGAKDSKFKADVKKTQSEEMTYKSLIPRT